MTILASSGWRMFGPRQKVRCPCGRVIGEASPTTRIQARPRPEHRAQGDRDMSLRCDGCGEEVDIKVMLE